MKTIKYLFILAAAAFIFNSCTKDVAGPTGPTGPQGAQGASSSYTVYYDSVMPAKWAVDASISGFSFTMNNVSALTTPNNTIVDVYFSTSLKSLSATWFTMPVESTFATGDLFQYFYETYSVTVQYINSTPPPTLLYFKVVIITNP